MNTVLFIYKCSTRYIAFLCYWSTWFKESIEDNIGGTDIEYDYDNILAVYKTMYDNASKITLNAMCRK